MLLLARYLSPATFFQEFIHEVRNSRLVKDDTKVEMPGESDTASDIQRPETVTPPTLPVQRPVSVPDTPKPKFQRTFFSPQS